MIGDGDPERDLAALVVPQSGRLEATGNRYEPYRLIDPDGAVVQAVTDYFRDLLAAGGLKSTLRSYGLALLRWFRFCWSDSGVAWDRAARADARDFSRWLQVRQASPAALAHDAGGAIGSGWCGCSVRAVGARALGDGAAIVLRLSS